MATGAALGKAEKGLCVSALARSVWLFSFLLDLASYQLAQRLTSLLYIHTHTYTVPVIKKLKYSTAGTERVRSRFARSSLVVRNACANRYGAGALQVRCACAAVIRGRHAHRIRVLTAVENYPLLRVVGEDHLDHNQIQCISPWPREHAMRYN